MRRASVAMGLALQLCACLNAQGEPKFEVVSIKPTPDPPVRSGTFPAPGQLGIGNWTLKQMILTAYGIREHQLSGGPAWTGVDRYDVVARASIPARLDLLLQMVRPMLADRFQLKMHSEKRLSPAYALVVAKNGPKVKLAADQSKNGGHTPIRGGFVDARLSMGMLASMLSGNLDRPVADETGLAGVYQFDLKYTPDLIGVDDDSSVSVVTTASIFRALQDQLGLKLENRQTLIEVFFIDHAERPTAN